VDDVLTRARDFNNELQTFRLTPIKERLKTGLNLADADIIEIPVLFDTLAHGTVSQLGTIIDVAGADAVLRTVAFTPGMVNMLVVDNHAMVPRPFGPRMKTADVVSILTAVGLSTANAARVSPLEGHWFWVPKGQPLLSLEVIFGVPAATISSHASNSGKFDGAGKVKNHWDKIWIPEDNVDLFEAHLQLSLEDIGVTVHWLDDWDLYHTLDGEVHCGTNVVRTPPEAASGYSGPHWWDAYPA
jgi:protein-arginine deiminase (PAD)